MSLSDLVRRRFSRHFCFFFSVMRRGGVFQKKANFRPIDKFLSARARSWRLVSLLRSQVWGNQFDESFSKKKKQTLQKSIEEVLINSMSFSKIDLIIKIRMMIIEVDISLKCKLSSTSVLLIEQGWIQDFSSGGCTTGKWRQPWLLFFFLLYFFFRILLLL